jgi:hypothetical protein
MTLISVVNYSRSNNLMQTCQVEQWTKPKFEISTISFSLSQLCAFLASRMTMPHAFPTSTAQHAPNHRLQLLIGIQILPQRIASSTNHQASMCRSREVQSQVAKKDAKILLEE